MRWAEDKDAAQCQQCNQPFSLARRKVLWALFRRFHWFFTLTDPYHAAAIFDSKRGWTGMNNARAIFRMHNLFWVHCLCLPSLVSNPKWRLRDKDLLQLKTCGGPHQWVLKDQKTFCSLLCPEDEINLGMPFWLMVVEKNWLNFRFSWYSNCEFFSAPSSHTKTCWTQVSISFSTTVEIVEEFSVILVRIIRCLFLLLPNQYEFVTLATRLFYKDTRGDSPRCYQSAHPLWSMRKSNPLATRTPIEFLVTRRPTFCSIFQE